MPSNDNYGVMAPGSFLGHLAQGMGQGDWSRYVDPQKQLLGQPLTQPRMTYAGSSILVVCNGLITEMPAAATLEAAQTVAERLAHQQQTEAFILKPVRKVAPKRDVVTTDL